MPVPNGQQQILDSASGADLYRDFFEEAADGLFIVDREWRFVTANRQWLDMTGYTLPELMNIPYFRMLTAEDLSRQPLLSDILRKGHIATQERCFQRRDGSHFYAEIRGRMQGDGNVVCVARDITERKRSEASAAERTRELAALQTLGLVVSSSLSLNQVGKAALQGILAAVQPDLAYLFLRHGDKLHLQEIAPQEALPRLGVIPEHRVGECMCGLSVKEERPLYSRDIHTDSRCTWDECKAAGIRSFATLPLRSGPEIIGVIGLASLTDRDFEASSHFLETLAHQVSLALANARHYELARQELAERKIAEEQLYQETVYNQIILESLPGLFYLFDQDGRILQWNSNFVKISGYTPVELASLTPVDFFLGEDREKIIATMNEVFQTGEATVEANLVNKDGKVTPYLFFGRRFLFDGRPCVTGMGIDISERRKAVEALRESEEKARAIFERSPVGLLLIDKQSRILECNEHFARIFGAAREQYHGINLLDRLPPGPIRQYLIDSMTGEGLLTFIGSHTSIFTGKEVHLSIATEKVNPDLFVVVMADITEQKEAAIAHERLQEQLLQSQKMESVGRLAGGVAHDFNNMLTAILGHTELAIESCSVSDAVYSNLKIIESAAHRSADLVRQLLAFARKQTVDPKILDLNDRLAGILTMLSRMIGENIELVWKPKAGLWPVKIDPSQIDQLLANLCVNARDAIDGVGKITIDLRNTPFDAEQAAQNPAIIPGDYVELSVSDTGLGIDKEILEHIFEPFFTTKEVGKGTGLGLSTVYGIAKQNQGFVSVYSEPGTGTTFKVYLPRFVPAILTPHPAHEIDQNMEAPRGRGQLVLLVEDEEVILDVGQTMLMRLGYTVVAALTPREALRAAQAHAGEIQLLITDVIMPEMNGRDLAELLVGIIPGLKCLFTSGYTADIIANHGVVDTTIAFIQKPFSYMELAVKVNELLVPSGAFEA
ncbi:MAG: PAS domain S-box protein [Desulforhopalus sp.]|nr:PAS domain S-box protein [Desulforhopalus sp.]